MCPRCACSLPGAAAAVAAIQTWPSHRPGVGRSPTFLRTGLPGVAGAPAMPLLLVVRGPPAAAACDSLTGVPAPATPAVPAKTGRPAAARPGGQSCPAAAAEPSAAVPAAVARAPVGVRAAGTRSQTLQLLAGGPRSSLGVSGVAGLSAALLSQQLCQLRK